MKCVYSVGGQIPDAAMIHMARKRRQLAREQGDDFLPLEDTDKVEKNKSRLVREDDNDRSDEDEDDDRIDFAVNSKEKARRFIETTILAAGEGESVRQSGKLVFKLTYIHQTYRQSSLVAFNVLCYNMI